jgi:hypothetical protein
MTVEKEWLEKKLKSLGLSDKKQLIEPKLDSLSLTQQCALLGLNRSSYYYQNKENQRGVAIFAKACFGHPSPSKQQKLNATANAFGAPDVLRTCHFASTIVNSVLAS